MKKEKVAFVLGFFLIVIIFPTLDVAEANPMYTQIPPKVTANSISVNATISKVNESLFSIVDLELKMHTVYSYGDSYSAENNGMGLVTDSSPYVTVTVTENMLEAYLPVANNVTDISVKVDNQNVLWQLAKSSFPNLYGQNLPQINWTIQPVPKDFDMIIHYEQPITENSAAYRYLGDYAFLLPVYCRFGCSSISYPLYDLAGYSTPEYNIQVTSEVPEVTVYSIENTGTLTKLNATKLTETGLEKISASFSHSNVEHTVIQGAVAVFNLQSDSPVGYSQVLIVIAGVTFAVVVFGVIIYLKKHNR